MIERDETRDRAKRLLTALAKVKDASRDASKAISNLNTASFDTGTMAKTESEIDIANQLFALAAPLNDAGNIIGELQESLAKIYAMPDVGQLEIDVQFGSPPS